MCFYIRRNKFFMIISGAVVPTPTSPWLESPRFPSSVVCLQHFIVPHHTFPDATCPLSLSSFLSNTSFINSPVSSLLPPLLHSLSLLLLQHLSPAHVSTPPCLRSCPALPGTWPSLSSSSSSFLRKNCTSELSPARTEPTLTATRGSARRWPSSSSY